MNTPPNMDYQDPVSRILDSQLLHDIGSITLVPLVVILIPLLLLVWAGATLIERW